jgi:hypothetical protein
MFVGFMEEKTFEGDFFVLDFLFVLSLAPSHSIALFFPVDECQLRNDGGASDSDP